jgi:transcriptional regulator with AAA-type ATPase domain
MSLCSYNFSIGSPTPAQNLLQPFPGNVRELENDVPLSGGANRLSQARYRRDEERRVDVRMLDVVQRGAVRSSRIMGEAA